MAKIPIVFKIDKQANKRQKTDFWRKRNTHCLKDYILKCVYFKELEISNKQFKCISIIRTVFIIRSLQESSHYIASPAAGLGIWVIRHIDFVLVAVDKEAPGPPLPLVVDLGHWDDSHLVPLSQDLLLGELGGVAGHQLGRGHLDWLFLKTWYTYQT